MGNIQVKTFAYVQCLTFLSGELEYIEIPAVFILAV